MWRGAKSAKFKFFNTEKAQRKLQIGHRPLTISNLQWPLANGQFAIA
jgi:hypothetical protein